MKQALNRVKQLRPIDDVFFEKLIEDKNVCEEILRVILEDNNLKVLSVTPQKSIKNLYGRSIRLDAYCRLGNGDLCNIEVQRSDKDDHVKRVRYNASCITANNTDVGVDFVDVPDVTIIFISAFDIFKQGRTIYHCGNMIQETNTLVDNGLREIYVNTAINDGSEIAELMKCFLQEQIDNEKFPLLSDRVWYFKNDEGGLNTMCKIVEDYAKEIAKDYAKEIADKRDLDNVKNMFKNKGSLELAIATFKNVSEATIQKIYEEVIDETNT